jgi:hypothetical protein
MKFFCTCCQHLGPQILNLVNTKINKMGAVMIQGAKDYVECSKILHLPNFQKSLKKF